MSSVPEISYANTDPDQVLSDVLGAVESNLGRSLYPGDPLRLFALGFAAEDVQIRDLLDEAGRQNLLSYATGANLDALGELVGVTRLSGQGSKITLRFTASSVLSNPITIPAGTRVTPDGSTYFSTDVAAVIQAGTQTIDVTAACTIVGDGANGYIVGEINQIVDPIANVPNVSNITQSSGGYDAEGDEAYRERIRLGPTAFSVAGSRDAYEYWARTASAQIVDVYVASQMPGYVNVYVLLQGGRMPDSETLTAVTNILSQDTVRPLTDHVQAQAPGETNYTVTLSYYIRTSDAAKAAQIQAAVTTAVNDWISWQRTAIGRDVNPSELVARIMSAGAKRVEISSPTYQAVPNTNLAVITGTPGVTYGGLEDE